LRQELQNRFQLKCGMGFGNLGLDDGMLEISDWERIWGYKQEEAKAVPMLSEDIDLVKEFPKALPDVYFFRHPVGISGCTAGDKFGERYLYKWWKKACKNLGIEGVDLYGGTRHSSAMALRQYVSPEEIRRAMMHSTNKAFERYFRIESDEVRNIYQLTLSREKQNKKKYK